MSSPTGAHSPRHRIMPHRHLPADSGAAVAGVSLVVPDDEASVSAARINVPVADSSATELLHDLRQPLTCLKMNLQAALRLLRSPDPHVDAAVEAIEDCLGAQRDVASLLAFIFGRDEMRGRADHEQ